MQEIGQKAGFLQLFTAFGEEKKAVFAFKKQKAKAAAFSAQANTGHAQLWMWSTFCVRFKSTVLIPQYQYDLVPVVQ
jgi:hypothetical protein